MLKSVLIRYQCIGLVSKFACTSYQEIQRNNPKSIKEPTFWYKKVANLILYWSIKKKWKTNLILTLTKNHPRTNLTYEIWRQRTLNTRCLVLLWFDVMLCVSRRILLCTFQIKWVLLLHNQTVLFLS